MPFDDEISPDGVHVHAYREAWASEAAELGAWLGQVVPTAAGVEHIGSTSVPGMAAKDCLDMMVVVNDLVTSAVEPALTSAGYRRRPEPWNNLEEAGGSTWPKMVFAPPAGARSVNIHIRTIGSATLRVSLLFRDHLRANPERTRLWSQLKSEASLLAPDLAAYGRLKLPAWCLLMELAEVWATEVGWTPPRYLASPRADGAR